MTEVFTVADESGIAEARRAATRLAGRLGFGETETGRVAIVATELASNLIKHARGGSLLLSAHVDRDEAEVEMISLDQGPGIADAARALRDGYSTAGSAGQGLGAIDRQSGTFDLISWPDRGTAVLSRVPGRRGRADPPPGRWGIVNVALAGEEVCGDGAAVQVDGGRLDVLVVDGLGHGPGAARAAGEALRIFADRHREEPMRIVEHLHAGLRPTRGAAVAVARIEPAIRSLRWCGLGNIAGGVFGSDAPRRLVSQNGTAGLAMHRLTEIGAVVGPEDAVVIHSDGIATSWSLDRYPGLVRAHPALIAAVLWRDHRRERDDATVLVIGGLRP